MGLFRLLLRLIAGIGGILAISEYLRRKDETNGETGSPGGGPPSTIPPGKQRFQCGRGSGEAVTREIGAEGGQIGVAGHLLVIPPGALDHARNFRMQELRTPDIRVVITPHVKFEAPATLTLSWARCPGGVDPNEPSIYNVDDNKDFGGESNLQERSVSAQIPHCSRYAIAQI